jgi:DNA repair exonuclease SbcCD ATPase subunit
MALTFEDAEFDDDVFESYNRPNKTKPLDDAYQGLLEQRNKLLIPGVSTEMTEDDLLLNTNLQTSALFNRLSDEFKKKQTTLEEYNRQLERVRESSLKISSMIDELKKIYIVHQYDSTSINKLSENILSYFKETNPKVTEIIEKNISKVESEVYDISNKLNGLRNIIVTGVNELVKPESKEKKICSVCFDKEVDTALIPCGHTYCKVCAETDRSRYAKCPHCRVQINSRIKIFFSV